MSSFAAGVSRATPVVVAYVPIAFAYGVSAKAGGLSLIATTLMSTVVYAGASQMIAVTLLSSAQPMAACALTIFTVNLRGLVLATALAPYLARWPRLQRALFAPQVTDETFALHSTAWVAGPAEPAVAFGINVSCQLAWILGSVLGYLVGASLPDVRALGLDYALAAMFIALLVLQTRHRRHVLVATASAAIALALQAIGLRAWAAIIATLVGASIGLLLEER
jgi:4-azaleucine resistance transporter AzlC